ncbi:hypothetical protein B0H14DRAFT_3143185 [Mycena olivaceomarginata]|nr:hypothetical protein B0H14DRAFT_3143185 [Mycena olivaceomarginata]
MDTHYSFCKALGRHLPPTRRCFTSITSVHGSLDQFVGKFHLPCLGALPTHYLYFIDAYAPQAHGRPCRPFGDDISLVLFWVCRSSLLLLAEPSVCSTSSCRPEPPSCRRARGRRRGEGRSGRRRRGAAPGTSTSSPGGEALAVHEVVATAEVERKRARKGVAQGRVQQARVVRVEEVQLAVDRAVRLGTGPGGVEHLWHAFDLDAERGLVGEELLPGSEDGVAQEGREHGLDGPLITAVLPA